MVNHTQMISIILLAETAVTNGTYYPLKGNLGSYVAAPPKIFVKRIYNRHHNDNVQHSEFYEVFLEGTTEANLETLVKDFLGASTNASSGYVKDTANYPFWIEVIIVEEGDQKKKKNRAKFEVEARWSI